MLLVTVVGSNGGTPANDYCFFLPGRSNLQIPGSRIDCFPFKVLQNDSARSTLAKIKSVVKSILAGALLIHSASERNLCFSEFENGDDQFCLLDEHHTEDHEFTSPTMYFPSQT
jgi:hypothetical protein